MTEEEKKRYEEVSKELDKCKAKEKPVEMTCLLCIMQDKCELHKEWLELWRKKKEEDKK